MSEQMRLRIVTLHTGEHTRVLTRPQAQAFLDAYGSQQEKLAPVDYFEIDEPDQDAPDEVTLVSVFAKDGTRLADIGYKPYDEKLADRGYLSLS